MASDSLLNSGVFLGVRTSSMSAEHYQSSTFSYRDVAASNRSASLVVTLTAGDVDGTTSVDDGSTAACDADSQLYSITTTVVLAAVPSLTLSFSEAP